MSNWYSTPSGRINVSGFDFMDERKPVLRGLKEGAKKTIRGNLPGEGGNLEGVKERKNSQNTHTTPRSGF